jgi:pectinesterase
MPTRRAFLAATGLVAATSLRAQSSAGPAVIRAVVALDGSGDFPTVQRAVDHILDHAPRDLSRAFLEIRPGVYRERVNVPRDKVNFTFAGTDAASTVITANVSAAAAGGTFFSQVVEVNADSFEARNITFENTFGVGSQAVALSVHSDRATFRNCRFLGWQDTLYAAWGRQYYRDCYIEGHVDFIFGNAAAVFDRCQIHSRDKGYIAAPSRTAPDQPTGLIFRQCRLTAEPRLKGVFLGRPWRDFARTVYIDCWMGDHIRPEGWDNWGISAREKTAWFAESGSSGPGANPAARVPWARDLTPAMAADFAPENFLKGPDGWSLLK